MYVLHGTKINGNLLTVVTYYETYTHKNFSGILHAYKNDKFVNYFEYADLRLDGSG